MKDDSSIGAFNRTRAGPASVRTDRQGSRAFIGLGARRKEGIRFIGAVGFAQERGIFMDDHEGIGVGRSQRLVVDGQRPPVKRFRFAVLAETEVQFRQLVQDDGRLRMALSLGLLSDGQHASEERLNLAVFPLRVVEIDEIGQGGQESRVVGLKAFGRLQRGRQTGFGLGISAGLSSFQPFRMVPFPVRSGIGGTWASGD